MRRVNIRHKRTQPAPMCAGHKSAPGSGANRSLPICGAGNSPGRPEMSRCYARPDTGLVELTPTDRASPLADAEDREQRRWNRTRTVGMICLIIDIVCSVFAVVLAANIIIVLGEARQVRMELLDDAGPPLDWRTYRVSVTGGQFPSLLPEHPALVSAP